MKGNGKGKRNWPDKINISAVDPSPNIDRVELGEIKFHLGERPRRGTSQLSSVLSRLIELKNRLPARASALLLSARSLLNKVNNRLRRRPTESRPRYTSLGALVLSDKEPATPVVMLPLLPDVGSNIVDAANISPSGPTFETTTPSHASETSRPQPPAAPPLQKQPASKPATGSASQTDKDASKKPNAVKPVTFDTTSPKSPAELKTTIRSADTATSTGSKDDGHSEQRNDATSNKKSQDVWKRFRWTLALGMAVALADVYFEKTHDTDESHLYRFFRGQVLGLISAVFFAFCSMLKAIKVKLSQKTPAKLVVTYLINHQSTLRNWHAPAAWSFIIFAGIHARMPESSFGWLLMISAVVIIGNGFTLYLFKKGKNTRGSDRQFFYDGEEICLALHYGLTIFFACLILIHIVW